MGSPLFLSTRSAMEKAAAALTMEPKVQDPHPQSLQPVCMTHTLNKSKAKTLFLATHNP